MSTHIQKPAEKIPELRAKPPSTKEEKIDAQLEDSFPASDPPSFSGGKHIIGAPTGRESDSPTAESPAVIDAEKKVKDGKAAEPDKY
jgi:hypothetical protein